MTFWKQSVGYSGMVKWKRAKGIPAGDENVIRDGDLSLKKVAAECLGKGIPMTEPK